jgi:NADPH-dependent ferric siderophore reductase
MPPFKALTTISFPNLSQYLDTLIHSFSAHNMTLRPDGDGHAITSSFGLARMVPRPGVLDVSVEARDPADFNRLKHELTALIQFVARQEALDIAWTGDRQGARPSPDLRVLTVRQVEDVTPRLRRITFSGEDLDRYAVPDQIHCRLLFQDKDVVVPEWPHLDDDGRILWPESGRLLSRIFTVRRVDPRVGTLTIDFVLHGGGGPGAAWARTATPGDIVGILGPAAHGPRPARAYLLAGDETGLPGIARILEDLPATARGLALVEVADAGEEQELIKPDGVVLRWLHRAGRPKDARSPLIDALRSWCPPEDRDGLFCWVGAEYATFRALRAHLRDTLGLPASQVVAFSHWRRGMSEDDIAEAGIASVSA